MATTTSYDAIVIGAGPNGLAAASAPGQGRQEGPDPGARRPARRPLGEERVPPRLLGPRHPPRRGPDDEEGRRNLLDLEKHGLKIPHRPRDLHRRAGRPRNPAFCRCGTTTAAAIATRSRHDGDSYSIYRSFLTRIQPVFEKILSEDPPPLTPNGWKEVLGLARRGLVALKLKRKEMIELARVAPMCVADFLNEKFETPFLVEALAAPAVASTWSGPWSAGSNTNLLLRECTGGESLAGGPAALVAALVAAAKAAGAELRTNSEVARIRLSSSAGRSPASRSPPARRSTRRSSSPPPIRSRRCSSSSRPVPSRSRSRRSSGASAPAAAPPRCTSRSPARSSLPAAGSRHEAIRIGGGHVDDLERAFDAIKYRQFSARPNLDVRVPTVADPSLAPQGHHVVSILSSYAPYTLEGGWTEAAKTGARRDRRRRARAPRARRPREDRRDGGADARSTSSRSSP
jgi:phytoene dehydrogenase-like protein